MTKPASRYTPGNFAALVSVYWSLRLQVDEVEPINFESIENTSPFDYQHPKGLTVFSAVPNWLDYVDGVGRLVDTGDQEKPLIIGRLQIQPEGTQALRVTVLNTQTAMRPDNLLVNGQHRTRCVLLLGDVYRSWDEVNLAPYMRWVEAEIERLQQVREAARQDPKVVAKATAIRAFSRMIFSLVQIRRQARVEWKQFTEDCAYEPGIYATHEGIYVVAEAPSNFHDAAGHEEPLMLTVLWRDEWKDDNDLVTFGRLIHPPVLWLGQTPITWQANKSMEPWFAWLDEQIAQWSSLAGGDRWVHVASPSLTFEQKVALRLRDVGDKLVGTDQPEYILKFADNMAETLELLIKKHAELTAKR